MTSMRGPIANHGETNAKQIVCLHIAISMRNVIDPVKVFHRFETYSCNFRGVYQLDLHIYIYIYIYVYVYRVTNVN